MKSQSNRFVKRSQVLAAAAVAALATQSVLADGDFSRNVGASGFTWNTPGWTAFGDTGGQAYPGDGGNPGAGTETALLNFDNFGGDRTVTIGLAGGWTLDISALTAKQGLSTSSSRTLNLNATNAGTLFTNAITLDNFDGTNTSNSNRLNLTTNANLAISSRNAGADLLTINNNMQANSRQITINGSVTSTGLTLAGLGSGDSGRINLNGGVNAGTGTININNAATTVFGSTVNAATIATSVNATRTFSGAVTATNFNVGGGTVNLNGVNTIGTLNLTGGVTNLGTAGSLAGSTINLGAGAIFSATGTQLSGFTFGTTFNAAAGAIVAHNDNTGTVAGTVPAGVLYGLNASIAGVSLGLGGSGEYAGLWAVGGANRVFGTTTGGEVLSVNGNITIGNNPPNNPLQTTIDAQIVGGAGSTVDIKGLVNVRNKNNTWSPNLKIHPGAEFVVNIDLDTAVAGQEDGLGGITQIELAGGKLNSWNGNSTTGLLDGVLNQAINVTADSTLSHYLLNSVTYAGGISGSGKITFTGTVNAPPALSGNPGVHVLSTANAGYTGDVLVSSGGIKATNANALQNANSIEVTGGTVLLDPTITYTGKLGVGGSSKTQIILSGGGVGYSGNWTLDATNLPGVYGALVGTNNVLGVGALGDSGTITVANGPITDNGATPVRLVKYGFGSVLDLSAGANTFTGGTDIRQGTIKVTALDQLNYVNGAPASINIAGNGELHLSGLTGAAVNDLKITSNAGNLGQAKIKVDAGNTAVVTSFDSTANTRSLLTSSGDGTLAWITNATFASGNANSGGVAVINGSTLHFNQMPNASATGRIVWSTGGGTIRYLNASNSDALYGVNFSGPDAVTTQAFRGLTIGTGITGTVEVDSGKILRALGKSVGQEIFGTLNKTGAGELHLGGDSGGSAAPDNTTGAVNILAGAVQFGGVTGSNNGQSPFPDGIAIGMEAGTTLRFRNFNQGALVGAFSLNQAGTGTATFDNDSSSDLTIQGNIAWAGTLDKIGPAGTNQKGLAFALVPASTVSLASDATLQVSNGLLKVDATNVDPFSDTNDADRMAIINNSAGSTGFAGMTVTAGSTSVASLTGTGTTRVDSGATLALAGSAAHGQTTMTNNGTLNVGAGNAGFGTLNGTGTTNVSAGATLTLQGAANAQATINVDGTLAGNATIAANVNVNGPSGKVAPGTSAGTLTVNGSATIDAGGTYAVELESLASFDKLVVSGAASVAGSMTIDLLGAYEPAHSDTFTVLTSGGLTGTFANTNAWGLITVTGGGKAMLPEYTATDVILTEFTKVGDVDFDGVINNQDIGPFVAVLTGTPPVAPSALGFAADVDGNGVVNNQDIAPFVALLTGPRPLAELANDPDFAPLIALVPEPASLSLLALGGLALRRRRR